MVRWFIVLLLVANVALFFWVQRGHLDAMGPAEIPPPEIGRLRILNQGGEPVPADVEGGNASSKAQAGRTAEAPPGIASPITSRAHQVPPATQQDSGPDSPVEQQSARPIVQEPPALAEREVPVEPEEAESESELSPAPVHARACARVGPFTPAQADALLKQLPARIVLLSDTSEEVEVPDAYFAMHPALKDRAAGRRKVNELKGAGIEDLWLFPSGKFQNAISLGMFRRAASAQRRVDQVRKKGFEAEVVPKSSRQERRWLNLTQTGEDELSGAIPLPKGVTSTAIPCL